MMMGPAFGYGAAGCGITGVLFGIIVIGLLFFVLKNRGNKKELTVQSFNQQSAVDVLKIRLVKGEISFEEFEQLKNTLSK